jgi:glucosamine--fructose-6-phosphate aminotransferase (isomerizing)
MCGIFGYVGSGDVSAILAEGIRRLDYRGYDSWGMAVVRDGQLLVHRRVGRLTQVDAEFASQASSSRGGIAHTRWATHGEPSERNAHPHVDGASRFAVAHNGIIENFEPLRERLQAEGCRFASDTDSEVIAHLVARFYDGRDVRQAFLAALRLLRGTYGIAMMAADEPNTIYVARHSSPMVIGQGKGFIAVASDPSALVSLTRNVIYLEDGEVSVLRPDGCQTWNLQDVPVDKATERITFDAEAVERGGYAHFMLKEIFEQPRVRHLLARRARGPLHDRGTGADPHRR